MAGKTISIVMIVAITSVRSRMLVFVDVGESLNFSQSLEYCASITDFEDTREIQMTSELEDILTCSNQMEFNGVFWLNLTGPFDAYEGSYYIYLEASYIPEGKQFILESEILPDSDMCLLFNYHMYGLDIGKLVITLSSVDNVTIWEQEGSTKQRIWYSQNVDIISSGLKSVVRFVGVRGDGYRGDIALDNIRLKYGGCEMYPELSNKVCGDTYYSESGVIVSKNYPENYPSNSDCTWKIIVPDYKQIYLHPHDIQLETAGSNNCYDYLEILDGKSYERLALHCSMSGFRQTFETNKSSLILKFVSDQINQRRGFNITWTTVQVSCPVVQITNGNITSTSKPCNEDLQRIICVKEKTTDPSLSCSSCLRESTPTMPRPFSHNYTTTDAMTTFSGTVEDKNGFSQKTKTNPTTYLAGILGALAGILLLVAVSVAIVYIWRRRGKSKRSEMNSSGALNPGYSYNVSLDIKTNETEQKKSKFKKFHEKETSRKTSEVRQRTVEDGEKNGYINTFVDQDATYNQLNEAIPVKELSNSRYNDLNLYDHLSSQMQTDETIADDEYDHAGNHGDKERSASDESDESDYMNTVIHVPSDNYATIYEQAKGNTSR